MAAVWEDEKLRYLMLMHNRSLLKAVVCHL